MAELADPLRFAFDLADVINRTLRQPAAGIELVPLGEGEVTLAAVDVEARTDGLDPAGIAGVQQLPEDDPAVYDWGPACP